MLYLYFGKRSYYAALLVLVMFLSVKNHIKLYGKKYMCFINGLTLLKHIFFYNIFFFYINAVLANRMYIHSAKRNVK